MTRVRSRRHELLRFAVTTAVVAFLAACATEGGTEGSEPPASPPPVTEEVRELTVLHPFVVGDDREGLLAMLASFEVSNPGIRVLEEGVEDPGSRVQELTLAGAPPDVVIGSRPERLAALAADGLVRPLDAVIDRSRLESAVLPGVLGPVTFDDSLYATPVRLSMKSLVWYSPATFANNGYGIPATWDELTALSDRMLADGLTPWCLGIESGGATGWVATDWIEDILLRAVGGEDYERWVAGTLAFSSPEVRGAIEEYLVPIWTDDASVLGGRSAIAREPFSASVEGILGSEPQCGLHRQGMIVERLLAGRSPAPSFATDFDVFLLPPFDPANRPALGDADYASLVTDSEEARRFLTFLATPESGEPWAMRGGFLSPFVATSEQPPYPDGLPKRVGELLAQVTAFHLDGSNRMPPEVGWSSARGSFWSEITAWVREEQELDEALENIDARFARSR